MLTRRQFVQSVPAFAVASQIIVNDVPVIAQGAAPLTGHFHPQGKAPSKFTIDVLQ
jgi:hypothetical protein